MKGLLLGGIVAGILVLGALGFWLTRSKPSGQNPVTAAAESVQPLAPATPQPVPSPATTAPPLSPAPDAVTQTDTELRRREAALDEQSRKLAALQRASEDQQARQSQAADAQRNQDLEARRKSLADFKAVQEEQQRLLEATRQNLAEEKLRAEIEKGINHPPPPLPTKPSPQPAYRGPSSGEIVWEGMVKGIELITIEHGQSSSGSFTGDLPGVVVILQPTDPKKVSIASAPGSKNQYKRMVVRVVGNGRIRAVIRWSLP